MNLSSSQNGSKTIPAFILAAGVSNFAKNLKQEQIAREVGFWVDRMGHLKVNQR